MTVTTNNSRITYIGDGSTTVFPFPYYFLLATDVKIYVSGSLLTSGYTVSGAGVQAGGSVTVLPAPAVGAPIILLRDPDAFQNTVMPPNDPFPAKSVESGLDKLTMLVQRVYDRLTRIIQFPDVDTNSIATLPPASARISQLMGFDPLGNPAMYPIAASIGAGDMRVDTFAAGVDFTTGVTTQLTLSRAPGNPANLEIFFDGVYQGPDQWSVVGIVVTFTGAIPAGVSKVFARIGTTLSTQIPPDQSVTDAKAANGSKLSNRIADLYDVRDFGALVDGVTNDAAAFAAAVAGTPATAVLYVPGNAVLNSNVNAPNRHFLVNGKLLGTGGITGDSNKVTYSYGVLQSAQTPFGAGFIAHEIDNSDAVNTHSNTIATRAIVRKSTGSGTNGPSTSDLGLLVSSEKKNWQTTTVQGEVDGLYVVVRQGQKGDQAGVLVDHRKVGGVTEGSEGVEIAGSWVDTNNIPTYTLQTVMNFLEGAGGFSGGTGYGFWAENQVGGIYSAFHAGNNGGSFQNVLTAGSSRNPASLYFQVDGTGRVRANGGTQALPSYSFVGSTANGMYLQNTNAIGFVTNGGLRMAIDPSGNLLAGADNTQTNGTPTNRWSVIYAGTGTINTSDEREKDQIEPIPDAVLDAWATVEFCRFRYRDAIKEKADGARWHFGLIAQRIEAAFKAAGLDAFACGVLCYDAWGDEWETWEDIYEDVPPVFSEEVLDELGNPSVVTPATKRLVAPAGKRKTRDAGNRYGVRYEEALCLEAALMRRTLARLQAPLAPAI